MKKAMTKILTYPLMMIGITAFVNIPKPQLLAQPNLVNNP